jgi:hypothetical protein
VGCDQGRRTVTPSVMMKLCTSSAGPVMDCIALQQGAIMFAESDLNIAGQCDASSLQKNPKNKYILLASVKSTFVV